jgi:hypothetical protein
VMSEVFLRVISAHMVELRFYKIHRDLRLSLPFLHRTQMHVIRIYKFARIDFLSKCLIVLDLTNVLGRRCA